MNSPSRWDRSEQVALARERVNDDRSFTPHLRAVLYSQLEDGETVTYGLSARVARIGSDTQTPIDDALVRGAAVVTDRAVHCLSPSVQERFTPTDIRGYIEFDEWFRGKYLLFEFAEGDDFGPEGYVRLWFKRAAAKSLRSHLGKLGIEETFIQWPGGIWMPSAEPPPRSLDPGATRGGL